MFSAGFSGPDIPQFVLSCYGGTVGCFRPVFLASIFLNLFYVVK